MRISDHEARGSIQAFNVEGISVAPGFPYKHVTVTEAGTVYLLSLSGMLGTGADGKLVGGMYSQVKQALGNVQLAIAAAAAHLGVPCGDALQHIAVSRVDLADLSQVGELNRAYIDAGMPFSARTAVQVAKLPLGAAVEITVTAVLPNPGAWSPRNR